MTTQIELQDVAKYYEMGESLVKAVDGISIKIEKGDFWDLNFKSVLYYAILWYICRSFNRLDIIQAEGFLYQ